jgi:hypothetical protein
MKHRATVFFNVLRNSDVFNVLVGRREAVDVNM